MAVRPIFVPKVDGSIGVKEISIDFRWHPGMAKVQKQKSIAELHESGKGKGINKPLEISSKSIDELGVELSAFNLIITTKRQQKKFTVECAFQGSKIFQYGGPYKDLLTTDSKRAKKDLRLKESGNLLAFEFYGEKFPIEPKTFFYDWIYINALHQNTKLNQQIIKYDGFTDIEFNPKKSINCQAHSVALYVSLKANNILDEALKSSSIFLDLVKDHYSEQSQNTSIQTSLI